ncbi:MAG: Ni/Co efflux regulator RcnB [Flavobacteriales bacterium]|jgi:Ni/Co efflux regulator RcnB
MKRFLQILLLVAFTIPFSAHGQKSSRKQRRDQIEQKGDSRAEIANNYQNGTKRHKTVQDKNTRKRMKRNAKKTQRLGNGKNGTFFQRIFRKKHFR